MKHNAYFEGLDWADLEVKELPPPLIPRTQPPLADSAASTADVYTSSPATKRRVCSSSFREIRGVFNTILP